MRNRHRFAAYLTIAVTLWLVVANAPAQIVIVVPDKSTIDSLSTKELQKLFKGQAVVGSKETPIQIVEFAPISDALYNQLYGLTAYAMGKHWLRLIFSGERVLPPKSFSEVAKFVRFLSTHENAIGFLPVEAFMRLRSDSLRAVIINGRDYRHPQYSLQ